MSKRALHPKCRPPRDACGPREGDIHVFALKDDGRWVFDDGTTPRVAFIGRVDGEVRVWVASCQCHKAVMLGKHMQCPRWKAFEHAREKLDIESISVQERPRKGGTLVPWPKTEPTRYLTNTPCDMWSGPCACGATHVEGR